MYCRQNWWVFISKKPIRQLQLSKETVLMKLYKFKSQGIITEEEFLTMKASILNK